MLAAMYDQPMSGYATAPAAYGASKAEAAAGVGLLGLGILGSIAVGVAGLAIGGWIGWSIAGSFAAPTAIQWAAAAVGAVFFNPAAWLGAIRRMIG